MAGVNPEASAGTTVRSNLESVKGTNGTEEAWGQDKMATKYAQKVALVIRAGSQLDSVNHRDHSWGTG